MEIDQKLSYQILNDIFGLDKAEADVTDEEFYALVEGTYEKYVEENGGTDEE